VGLASKLWFRLGVLTAGLLAASSSLALAAPKGVYLAKRDIQGTVRIVLRQGAAELPVPTELDASEWHSFRLRGLPATKADGAGAIEELGLEDLSQDLPRLRVRGDFQLVTFRKGETGKAGFAAIGSWGVKVLLYSEDGRYELREEGAAISPDGRILGLVCHGMDSGSEEVFLVDLSGPIPGVKPIVVPEPADRIEPKSLTLTNSAVFFSSFLDNIGQVHRASLESSEPVYAETVTGPFPEVGAYMASSKSSVVFLAGEKEDFWDVYAAGSSGAAVNVTRSPGPVLPHSPDKARLAVSEDGKKVAYSIDVAAVPETYWHDVLSPGAAGQVYLTGDSHFNPYIDQELWIFFDPSGNLLFTAGHAAATLDLYRVNTALLDNTINLTRTGGANLEPPFASTGNLSVQSVVLTTKDVVLVSATGFSSPSTVGLLGIFVADGTIAFERPGVQSASGFFSVGTDLYFSATRPEGNRGLFLLRSNALTEVGSVPLGREPRLLLRGDNRAIVLMPGEGLLALESASDPRLLVSATDMAPTIALDATGGFLVFGRSSQGGFRYFILNLATGTEAFFFEVPPGAATLAISQLPDIFLRGDSNSDGQVDISDPVSTLFSLFLGAHVFFCADAADTDDDGKLTVTDAIRTLLYLFKDGESLPFPFPEIGVDPTPDELGCR
jgi:hypothetical protein